MIAKWAHLPPEHFFKIGQYTLFLLFGGFLLLLFGILLVFPQWLPFYPLLIGSFFVLWVLFQRPAWHILLIIIGFYLISGYSSETAPQEILYTLYVLSYLAGWFLLQWFVYRRPVVLRWDDVVLMGLLIYATFSFVHNRILHGELSAFVNEWAALILLGLYFPIRDFVMRHTRGAQYVMFALLALATLMSLRNLYVIVQDYYSVKALWQLLLLREIVNKQYFVYASLALLILLLYSETLRARLLWFLLLIINFASLIGTQTRAMWLAFAMGVGMLFLLLKQPQRTRLLGLVILGLVASLGVGWVVFGKTSLLILSGLVNRIFSISSALTQDLSMINRYYEALQVWDYVKSNPIAGYGLGVPYRFYDLVHEVTLRKTWIHNGFIGVWYKFGIFGFAGLFAFWLYKLREAFRLLRVKTASTTHTIAMSIFVTLTVLFPTVFSHNPFHNADSLFLLAILTGLITGLYRKEMTPLST